MPCIWALLQVGPDWRYRPKAEIQPPKGMDFIAAVTVVRLIRPSSRFRPSTSY